RAGAPEASLSGWGILGRDRGLAWHRAVAPGVEVGEITTHGLALSRPRRGFESRWGDQISSLRFSAKTFRRRHGRDGKPLRPLICLGERRVFSRQQRRANDDPRRPGTREPISR